MSGPFDNLTLRQLANEAGDVIKLAFPYGGEPAGLKLAIVRALRKAESRGMQAVVDHFCICDDCSPVPASASQLADAAPKSNPRGQ